MFAMITVPCETERPIWAVLDDVCARLKLTGREAAGYYGCEPSLWSRIVSGERAFDLSRLDKFPQAFCQELTSALAVRFGLQVTPTASQEDLALTDLMATMMRWISVHERRKAARKD